jgi:hypothetical protein
MLGPVGASKFLSTTISPDEFIRSIHGFCTTLNVGLTGRQNASKEFKTIQNPSKECVLPTSETTSWLTTPLEEPSGELGRKGW